LKKIIKKLIEKNIIKILTIYQNGKEKCLFSNLNYLDNKIYFETKYLIRLIKERRNLK
jgi:ubiquitin